MEYRVTFPICSNFSTLFLRTTNFNSNIYVHIYIYMYLDFFFQINPPEVLGVSSLKTLHKPGTRARQLMTGSSVIILSDWELRSMLRNQWNKLLCWSFSKCGTVCLCFLYKYWLYHKLFYKNPTNLATIFLWLQPTIFVKFRCVLYTTLCVTYNGNLGWVITCW